MVWVCLVVLPGLFCLGVLTGYGFVVFEIAFFAPSSADSLVLRRFLKFSMGSTY